MNSDFPVHTGRQYSYTLEGKINSLNKHPSAFTYDIIDGTSPPLDFIEGEIICVRNGITEENCKYAPFIKYYNNNYRVGTDEENACYYPHARKLTKEERGEGC